MLPPPMMPIFCVSQENLPMSVQVRASARSRWTRTKERRTNSHVRSSFGNREFEVVAHAHGKGVGRIARSTQLS